MRENLEILDTLTKLTGLLVKNSLLIFPFKLNNSPIRDSWIFQEYVLIITRKVQGFCFLGEFMIKGMKFRILRLPYRVIMMLTPGLEAAILGRYEVNSRG